MSGVMEKLQVVDVYLVSRRNSFFHDWISVRCVSDMHWSVLSRDELDVSQLK